MITTLLIALLAQDLDAQLEAMMAARDARTYAAARQTVVDRGAAVLDALRDRGAADQWTAEGWLKALVAESCRLRIEKPEMAAAVDAPRGLNPEHYRQLRRPEPMPLPELNRLGIEAMPLLMERWRWTFESAVWSPGDAGELERARLREALLYVPGKHADPRARHFLADVLRSDAADETSRQHAAVSYAQCAGKESLPLVLKLLDDRGAPGLVREACARAMGRVPAMEALDAIRTRLDDGETDAQVRRSLLHGLGILGATVRRGPEAIRKGCADALVAALSRWPEEHQTLGIALPMVAWPDSLSQVEALASDATGDRKVREAAQSVLPVLRVTLDRLRK